MELGKLFAFLLTGAFSGALFFMGISNVRNRYSCKEKVNAVCVKLYTIIRQNVGLSNARFEYDYAGKKRYSTALEDLNRKQWKHFKEGETYTIYVNPKKPEMIRCTKTILRLRDLILILFGGFVLLGFIVTLLTNLWNLVVA